MDETISDAVLVYPTLRDDSCKCLRAPVIITRNGLAIGCSFFYRKTYDSVERIKQARLASYFEFCSKLKSKHNLKFS